MRFIQENWPIISLVLVFLMSLANTITNHFSNESGVKKWALVAVEVLSFFTSADVHDRIVKFPLTSVKPKETK